MGRCGGGYHQQMVKTELADQPLRNRQMAQVRGIERASIDSDTFCQGLPSMACRELR
jgi:hypothetical protein